MPVTTFRPIQPGRARAFTLTELLIVIGLIVLMIALAVPTFSFMTGSRSTDGAMNQISAMLARARTEAIGLQEIRGVFFYLEPRSDRIHMTIVHQTERPGLTDALATQVQTYVGLAPGAESVALPAGVGLQTITNCNANSGGVRLDDNYIGFNVHNRGDDSDGQKSDTPYGGVILFDSKGRLVIRRIGFRTYDPDASLLTPLGDLLLKPTGDFNTLNDTVEAVIPQVIEPTGTFPLQSSLGVVLFEQEAFRNLPRDRDIPKERDAKLSGNDFTYGNGSAEWHEAYEESWLDGTGTDRFGHEFNSGTVHCLVNRYNGTLIRAE